jgi:hypothetical protein
MEEEAEELNFNMSGTLCNNVSFQAVLRKVEGS